MQDPTGGFHNGCYATITLLESDPQVVNGHCIQYIPWRYYQDDNIGVLPPARFRRANSPNEPTKPVSWSSGAVSPGWWRDGPPNGSAYPHTGTRCHGRLAREGIWSYRRVAGGTGRGASVRRRHRALGIIDLSSVGDRRTGTLNDRRPPGRRLSMRMGDSPPQRARAPAMPTAYPSYRRNSISDSWTAAQGRSWGASTPASAHMCSATSGPVAA